MPEAREQLKAVHMDMSMDWLGDHSIRSRLGEEWSAASVLEELDMSAIWVVTYVCPGNRYARLEAYADIDEYVVRVSGDPVGPLGMYRRITGDIDTPPGLVLRWISDMGYRYASEPLV